MNIDRILASAPINRSAASVVSVRRGAVPAGDLTKDELVALRARLDRKLRLLKQVLKITSRAQHKNLVNAINRGMRNRPGVGMLRLTANPRAALEYKRVGEQIHHMDETIAAINAAAKAERTVARPVIGAHNLER